MQSLSSSPNSLALKPRQAWKETHSANWPRGGGERGGAERRDRPGAGRSQPAGGEGRPARAEWRGLSQAPDARCRWQLGGAAAAAAGGARVWRPLPASDSPFPPPNPRPDPGDSEGKSRCAGTCEPHYLSSALALLFFFEEGCAWGLRAGSWRGWRGRLRVTQVSAPPFRCPIPLRSRAKAGTPARPGGRGRGAGACPWLEVDEGESGEGVRLARPGGCLPRARLDLQGLSGGHPKERNRQRGALRGPEGLHPWFKLAGIAPTRAVREPQRSRARRLCEALERARWAGREQESSVPASRRRWRTSSLSAPATPPPPFAPPPLRARGSAYSEIPCLCQRAKWLLLSLRSLPSPELERPRVWLSGLGRLVVLQRRVGLASSPRGGRR